MSKAMRVKSWVANCPEPVFALIYFLILRPLILWNYHQREMGRLPDEWYWADSVGANRGYFTVSTPRRHPLKTAWIAFLAIILALAILGLQGCAYARYTDDTHSLTVIDLHPTGNSVALDAALTGKGKVTLNRVQGSAEGIVAGVVDAVSVNPLD